MRIFLKIIAPIAIIVLAFVGFKLLAWSKSPTESKQPREVIPVVELIQVSPEKHQPPVKSYGNVRALFETTLAPQVSGEIIFVSPKFRVGEKVEKDQLLVRIDATDFEASLAQQKSAWFTAERVLAEEKIRADQAKGDWQASGRKLSNASDFVLRKPQLAAAEGDIESAKAMIKKAEADLKRTEVRAPFAAVVVARNASPGNQVSPQQSLGTLVAQEKVEIRLPLTAEQSARISIPTKAELRSPLKPGAIWQAELIRMEPLVDERNQVIYAVAEILAPFSEDKPAISIGMFANATIAAKPIERSYEIPEAAFIQDKFIWTVDEAETLQRIQGKRLHSADGKVFIQLEDATDGELKIVSRPLSNFRVGTKVKAMP